MLKPINPFLLLLLFVLPSVALTAQVNKSDSLSDLLYPYHPDIKTSFESSNLPIVVINLKERMADKKDDKRVPANMIIISRKDGTRNYLSDTIAENLINDSIINYVGRIGIKYRGNSSFLSSDKKPFGTRTEDENGKKKEVNILEMGADSDWALLAPYGDKSLIRDVLTYELLRGYLEYVPTGKFCELVLNDVYQGVYIVFARVRRGEHRLNLPKPKDSGEALTGGYHLEIDRNDSPGFYSEYRPVDLFGNEVGSTPYYQYKYPDGEDYDDGMTNQKDYITNHVKVFEDVMAGEYYKDPEIGYRKYLDVTSAIDYILAQELTRNSDAYRLSVPIYKYPDNIDPRFKFSIWDFNHTMGNAYYCDSWSTEGWAWNLSRMECPTPFWFKKLLSDDYFMNELVKRWRYYRTTNLSDENIAYQIDSLTNLLKEAEVRNTHTWNPWNQWFFANYAKNQSWEEEIDGIKTWLKKRIEWIDSQLLTANMANKLANPSFDSDLPFWEDEYPYLSSWEGNDKSGFIEDALEGKLGYYLLPGGTVTQIMTELPDGRYILKAWVKTIGTPNAEMYCSHHQKDAVVSKKIELTDEFQGITIPNVTVSSGICVVGFTVAEENNNTLGSGKLIIDDVSFTLQKSGVGIDDQEELYSNYTVYPNPFTEKVIFDLTPISHRVTILIYTATGVLIEQIVLPNQQDKRNTFEWQPQENLPTGMYLYRIIDGENNFGGKIMKTRF